MVTQPQNDGPAKGGSISYSKVVDLSWPIHPGIPQWPGDPGVEFETVASIEKDGYFLRRFSMGEHSGTHLSAPSGFYATAPGHEIFSPQNLVRPAIVIDVTDQAEADPNYALTMNDVLDWESDHGPIPQGCVTLLRTGWQAKWGSPSDYLGGNSVGQLYFPGFGLDAARLLLEGRNVAGLGIDTAGAEPGTDTEFTVSRFALEKHRIVLENLTNLDLLTPTGALVVIGLLRLEGGSGGPAAVTALVP
ncbi:MAG: cyclase family protein [SAR202 cluster bacterium]|nr:cyclase family protein [SAR202 cluster bacterium]